MAVSRIELVGTENLTSSEKILLYNTNTFKNESLINLLGLPRIDDISIESVDNILESLLLSTYYHPLEKPFTYINDRDDPLTGQGFDTIIFMRDDNSPLGYAYLGKEYGNTYTSKRITYVVDKVKISILGEGESLKIGDSVVKFDMGILRQNPRTDNVKKIPKKYTGFGNYGSYIKDFIAGNKKDILTESRYIKYEEYSGTLSLNTIELPIEYTDFNNAQVGFYQGDPSLYIWNNQGEYSIFSLTEEVHFNDTIKILKSYTLAKPGISKSEIYKLPDLGNESQKIMYFASQYCIVESDEEHYVLDIPRQSSPDDGPRNKGWLITGRKIIPDVYRYFTSGPDGWIETSPNSDAILFDSLDVATGSNVKVNEWDPIYLKNFVIDQSLRARICEVGSLGWRNYQEALKNIGNLCNTEIDSRELVESGCTVIKKIGNWFVFEIPTTDTYVYSNMTQTVEFLRTEDPIVVNDEVILCSYDDKKYTLFDSPGKYISKKYYNKFGTKKGYSLPKKSCTLLNPIDLQKSFFSAFRRNVLPNDLSDFKIIGALGGIIFYRTRNTISYI